jgi:ribosomal protein S18 acetylase RimI-like enzyme
MLYNRNHCKGLAHMYRVPSICPRLPEISVRPISDDDRPFLINVYANTRADQAITHWIDCSKQHSLARQFAAQHNGFQQQFPTAAFDLILLCDTPIGRISSDRFGDEIRIIELALLPEYRNQKIGTAFLQATRTEARSLGRAIRLHVEQCNRAMRLYRRFGFQPISSNGQQYVLEWRP